MWLQSTAVFSLAITFCAVCESAEVLSASAHHNLAMASLQSSPQTALSNSNQKPPMVIYQQALNHLLGRNGVDKSAKKAADLFKTLASQNWSSAQHMLGNMYYSGKGVEKNDLLAYKWLSLAAKNNIQLAEAIQVKRKILHKKLRANLSDQSFNKVETWIAEWEPESSQTQVN